MVCADLLLMVALERFLLLGVALPELLLLHHMGACVVLFLPDPLLTQSSAFRRCVFGASRRPAARAALRR